MVHSTSTPLTNNNHRQQRDRTTSTTSSSNMNIIRKSSSVAAYLCLSLMSCTPTITNSFTISTAPRTTTPTTYSINSRIRIHHDQHHQRPSLSSSSNTALNVWWFGGQESEYNPDDDECELVAVRIERPTSNSRRIMGEISVPVPIDDVWAILTDYDRLSIHVPNLVESKRKSGGRSNGGEQGDGQYQCRLYQKGAQKIIGFEFGASVTMDMAESILDAGTYNDFGLPAEATTVAEDGSDVFEFYPKEKQISFKCVESQFFSAFDGTWRLKETGVNGDRQTTVYYDVLVKPNGPVPVAALEWRIREDVPTNLRAVKKAATSVGLEGVMAVRKQHEQRERFVRRPVVPLPPPVRQAAMSSSDGVVQQNIRAVGNFVGNAAKNAANTVTKRRGGTPVPITAKADGPTDWNDDETMAVYL